MNIYIEIAIAEIEVKIIVWKSLF